MAVIVYGEYPLTRGFRARTEDLEPSDQNARGCCGEGRCGEGYCGEKWMHAFWRVGQ